MAWLNQMLGIYNLFIGLYFALELMGSLWHKSALYLQYGELGLLGYYGIPAFLFLITGSLLYYNKKSFIVSCLWTFPLAYTVCCIFFYKGEVDWSWGIPAAICLGNMVIMKPERLGV